MSIEKIISTVIAEDELPARELLIDYLLTRSELKLSGIAKNGKEALEMLSSNRFDLLFLDIHLPILSGIEVLDRLENMPYVIFTTAYDKYAIKAFDIGAVDYLIKPFSKERFDRAVDKFLQLMNDNKGEISSAKQLGLSFKEKGKYYLVAYDDIIYVSSHSKHTIIHTEDRDFEASIILKDVEKKLSENTFLRIHKQFIVNLQFVSHIEYYIGGQYLAFLKDKDESSLPIGRRYALNLKSRLQI